MLLGLPWARAAGLCLKAGAGARTAGLCLKAEPVGPVRGSGFEPEPVPLRARAYAVRTEYTGARWSATWVQLAPASLEPNTSPDVAPK